MRELSLFTGAGGGLLGTHLLGWTPIGYVEFNDYCQRVIRQRIIDGILPSAPIFGDIRAFISSGCAELYRGITDVITAGFPCQPFSVAGDMEAGNDDRNMWPATIDVIQRVRPPLVFLENVPGLLSSGYGFTVASDLQWAGYQVLPPLQLGAFDVGCHHRRNRIWIVAADPKSAGRERILCDNFSGVTKANKPGADKADTLAKLPDRISRIEQSLGKPGVFGSNDGLAYRVERLGVIGNGQVPAVVREAWRILIGGV